jgi:hypothetical protein
MQQTSCLRGKGRRKGRKEKGGRRKAGRRSEETPEEKGREGSSIAVATKKIKPSQIPMTIGLPFLATMR